MYHNTTHHGSTEPETMNDGERTASEAREMQVMELVERFDCSPDEAREMLEAGR